MKYKTVTGADYGKESAKAVEEFEDKVNKEIKAGWIPIGGICVTPIRTPTAYLLLRTQAMIFKEEKTVDA